MVAKEKEILVRTLSWNILIWRKTTISKNHPFLGTYNRDFNDGFGGFRFIMWPQ